MFQQLVPLLRQRAVLLTVTHVEEDEIRVNLMPKKLADSENSALTTPMSFTGTGTELDEQLPAAINSFVASHLELKSTLARAKEEMAAAAKAAQEEARNKVKNNKKPATGAAKMPQPAKEEESKTEPDRSHVPGLFDAPCESGSATAPMTETPAAVEDRSTSVDEEHEIMKEISEQASANDADEEAGRGSLTCALHVLAVPPSVSASLIHQ